MSTPDRPRTCEACHERPWCAISCGTGTRRCSECFRAYLRRTRPDYRQHEAEVAHVAE